MTSNVGAETLQRNKTVGFNRIIDEAEDYNRMKERVMEQMKHTFRPEFLNRVDEMIVFQSLNDQQLKEIVDLLLKDLARRMEENGFKLELTDEARAVILKEGYEPAYGARPLKRAIQKLVEDAISEEILKKTVEPGDHILVDARDKTIVVGKK